MPAPRTSAPVILIPARRQALWGWPAVANFALGGLGAGLYVGAAVAAGFEASSAVRLAAWLSPGLVLAGFAAVAVEAGHPLRGPRVLARLQTSWMSRELWLGVLFAVLAAGEFVSDQPVRRLAATATALALALAQGFILRRAPGVAAWDTPWLPPLFLTSALLSGTGGLVLTELAQGRPLEPRLGGAALALVVLHASLWWAYLGWSVEAARLDAVQPLREGRDAVALLGAGCLLPSFLLAAAIALPEAGRPLAALGALALGAGQLHLKAALILKAGLLRPVTLPQLSRPRRSR